MATANTRARAGTRPWLIAAAAAGLIAAAETGARASGNGDLPGAPDDLSSAPHSVSAQAQGLSQSVRVMAAASAAVPDRHPLRTAMYGSYVLLNALDTHSTLLAKSRGAYELNPVLNGLGGSPTATVGIKMGMAALTLYTASRLARTHPRAALLTMVTLNSVYVTIVAHNYHVAGAHP